MKSRLFGLVFFILLIRFSMACAVDVLELGWWDKPIEELIIANDYITSLLNNPDNRNKDNIDTSLSGVLTKTWYTASKDDLVNALSQVQNQISVKEKAEEPQTPVLKNVPNAQDEAYESTESPANTMIKEQTQGSSHEIEQAVYNDSFELYDGRITWDTTAVQIEEVMKGERFTRDDTFNSAQNSNYRVYTYNGGILKNTVLFDTVISNIRFYFDSDRLTRIELYPIARGNNMFIKLQSNISKIYGEPVMGEHTPDQSIDSLTYPAWIWRLSNATIYLRPTEENTSFEQIISGETTIVVSIDSDRLFSEPYLMQENQSSMEYDNNDATGINETKKEQTPITSEIEVEKPTDAKESFRVLKEGCKGQDVLNARQRLYELGYFKKKPTQLEYTHNMVDYVKRFERDYSLEQDGILSIEDQIILFMKSSTSGLSIPKRVSAEIVQLGKEKSLSAEKKVLISWAKSEGASYYLIQMSKVSDFSTVERIKKATGESCYDIVTDYISSKPTKLYYRVKAANDEGSTEYSKEVSVTLPARETVKSKNVTQLKMPKNVTVKVRTPKDKSSEGKNTVELKWDKVEGATSYIVEVSKDSAFKSIEGRKQIEKNSYTYTASEYSTSDTIKLYYRIKAKNDKVRVESKYSKVVSASIKTIYKDPIYPLELKGFSVGYNSIGTPEVYVKVKNTSKKTSINAFTFQTECFDAYGNRLKAFGFGDSVQYWIWQEGIIKPNKTWSSNNWRWTLYGFDEAYRIEVRLVDVHTTDGRTITYPSTTDTYYWTKH